jgi:hypothetical protein
MLWLLWTDGSSRRSFFEPEHERALRMAGPAIALPREKIADFCPKNRIRRLALLGSVLREDFTADSDVDVLIEFEPGTRVGLRFFAMERELSELLGRPVDLNTPGFLSDDILKDALAEVQVEYDSAR